MSGTGRARNNLVALGTAAVLAVYAAGYVRTRAAAQRFADESAERRPPMRVAMNATSVETAALHPDVAPPASAPADTTGSSASPHGAAPHTQTAATPSAPSAPHREAQDSARKESKKPPASDAHPTRAAAAVVADSSAAAATTQSTPAKAAADTAHVKTVATADTAAHGADTAHVAWKDGLYFGWGTSRHGDIQAGVEIKDGRIKSAFISECLTQYSCSWVAALPAQVVARQSAEVDYVSGATQSANAFYYAVVQALKKAQ